MQIYRGLKQCVLTVAMVLCLRAVQIYRGLKQRAVSSSGGASLRAVQIYRGLKQFELSELERKAFESSADL